MGAVESRNIEHDRVKVHITVDETESSNLVCIKLIVQDLSERAARLAQSRMNEIIGIPKRRLRDPENPRTTQLVYTALHLSGDRVVVALIASKTLEELIAERNREYEEWTRMREPDANLKPK